MYKDEH